MLLVCSKSTRGFFPHIKNVRVISERLDLSLLEEMGVHEDVLAVGGGAVIDAAKILSAKPVVCYPTTAAGSACTMHSVVWDNDQKISVKRFVPKEVIVEPEFLKSLPADVIFETKVDLVAHCFDSSFSKRSSPESARLTAAALEVLEDRNLTNESLIVAGNLAGRAIQITPTTILHSLSYPLTGRHGIRHGRALSYFLPALSDYMGFEFEKYFVEDFDKVPSYIDIEDCLRGAMSYDKINDFRSRDQLNFQFLKNLLCL